MTHEHKFTADHPAFQRFQGFIEAQVQKCRPSAINIATQRVIAQGHVTADNYVRAISEEVDRMEFRMEKRLRRQYGLTGKYVGH